MKLKASICALILAFATAFTIFYGGQKISQKSQLTQQTPFKGIITLWQIDTFEGGTGSRKQFLLSLARGFEKQNTGVLVMVVSHTAESAKNALEKGEAPDAVSFGNGVEVVGAKAFGKSLAELVKDQRLLGGVVGENLYAIPWAMGGYALIANPKLVKDFACDIDELLVSQNQYTQPLIAFSASGYTAKKIEALPPMNAYVKFTSNKTPYFLGTQRDIVRLKSRGMEFKCVALTEYNDLYQYISVTSADSLKAVYAERFVEYILQEQNQKRLAEINMLSPYTRVEVDGEGLNNLQEAVYKSTLSAFTSPHKLIEMQALSRLSATGDKESLIKLKNLLL